MTRSQIHARVRRYIGGVDVNTITSEALEEFIEGAMFWLAGVIEEFEVVETDQAIALAASQRDYPLPLDCSEMILVQWNETRLRASSTNEWDRNGTQWRTSEAATPSEYAIQGRRLWLNPPPSADAITTDGTLTLRYIACPGEMGVSGPVQLPPLAHDLLCYEAAYRWLGTHPGEENLARMEFCKGQIARLLPQARRQSQGPSQEHAPRFWPGTYRRGSAR